MTEIGKPSLSVPVFINLLFSDIWCFHLSEFLGSVTQLQFGYPITAAVSAYELIS